MEIKDSCILCTTEGGVLIAQAQKWRVIRAQDQKDYPLTYRVIWQAHVAEFSDLSPQERIECMNVVAWVEQAMRKYLAPVKINLASLGNVVSHLHWHIIARYKWDSHYPAPIWAEPMRDNVVANWAQLGAQQDALERYLKNSAAEIEGAC